jgi:ubiquinone/menaquinone biosynthesis C-methylase UbiE
MQESTSNLADSIDEQPAMNSEHFPNHYIDDIEEDVHFNYFAHVWRDVCSDIEFHSLLDIGCGNGVFSAMLGQKANLRLCGVDGNPYAVEQAKKIGFDEVKLVKDFNFEALPYESNSFDMILCKDVLEHLFDPAYLLREAYRVLKSDGFLLIHVPNHFSMRGRIHFLFTNNIDPFNYFPESKRWNFPHIRFFTYKSLVELLDSKQFSTRKNLSYHFPSLPFSGLIPFKKQMMKLLIKLSTSQFAEGFTILASKSVSNQSLPIEGKINAKSTHLKARRTSTKVGILDPSYILFKGINKFVADFIKMENRKFETIVDYGSGETPYRDFFRCNHYITCDVGQNSQGTIEKFIAKDQKVDLPDSSADLIICMDVLEHIAKPELALKEIGRIAKKGASVIISVPFLYREHEAPYDYYRYTTFCLERLINESSVFDIELKKKIGGYNYTAYSVWNSGPIKNPEREEFTWFSRVLRSIIRRTILPLLNLTVFKKEPSAEDTVFHHILLLCRKTSD